MSDEMSPDLRALLDEEKERPGPTAADSEALRAGLGSLLDGGGGGGGSGGGGGAGAGLGGSLGKLAGVFIAGALAGGAVIYAVAPRTVVERVTVEAPASAAPASPPAMPSASTADVPEPAPAPSASIAKAATPEKSTPLDTPASADKRDDDLASERALLERARVALGRGDATGALEAVDRHASRHPSGRLAEEREVLAVQALVSAGRNDEARARAARFHRDHPTSAFGSAIDALVR